MPLRLLLVALLAATATTLTACGGDERKAAPSVETNESSEKGSVELDDAKLVDIEGAERYAWRTAVAPDGELR